MARLFILLGLVFLAIGVLWPILTKLPFGHLPGDFAYRRGNVQIYFPLATSLLLSLLLTVLLTLLGRR